MSSFLELRRSLTPFSLRSAILPAIPTETPRSPQSLRDLTLSYLALTRFYTVLPLALLASALGSTTGAPDGRVIAAAVAIACAVAGGYAYNDLRDQHADRVNRPARPLVSGRLSDLQVRRFVATSFGAAVLLALSTTSLLTIAFIVLLVFSLQFYSDAVKRIAGLKNVFVGVWCGLLPWGASLDRVTAETILPAAAMIGLFITQKELVADVYDRDGDAAAGLTTIPVLIGSRTSLALVAALNVLLWLVVRSAGTVIPYSPLVERLWQG